MSRAHVDRVPREESTNRIERDALLGMLAVEREPTTQLIPRLQLRELLADVAPPPEITIQHDAATSWPAWLVGSAIALGSAVMIAMLVT